MNRNLLKLIVACGATCFIACTAPQKAETEKWSERMARSEMKRFPEPWMIEKAKKPRWGYTHGLVVKSMLEEWKHTGDSTYYEYAKIYADSLIDADGHIKTMKYLSFNIDNVNGGKIDPENQSHSSSPSPSSSKRLIPIHLSHITPVYHFLHQLTYNEAFRANQ